MEEIIQLVTVLFILSMIFERINEFLKQYLSCKKVVGLGWYIVGDTTTKYPTRSKEEKRREYRILKMNLFIGFMTSFFAHASFFDLLKNIKNPGSVIGWPTDLSLVLTNINFGTPFQFVIGCLFTGAFISMGSKFWHDLLDLLLYTKNLKEKLADPRTYEVETTEQLIEFIETPEYKLAQLALEQHEARIKAIPGVFTIGAGYIKKKPNKIGCLEVHVDSFATASKIPSNVSFQMKSGKDVDIPVNTIITGILPSTSALSSGGGIANQDKTFGWGTAGAIVKDTVTQDQYILSCFHVLQGNGGWKGLSSNKNIVIHENNTDIKVGELKYGYRTEELDVGLAKIQPGISFSNAFVSNASQIREVKPNDAMRETGVRILGATTQQVMFGFVYNESWSAKFNYPDGSVWELKDLVVLSKINEQTQLQCLSKGGDSGAMVIADDNHVIGMVVGADKAFTYAIKMNKIAKNFDIEFI